MYADVCAVLCACVLLPCIYKTLHHFSCTPMKVKTFTRQDIKRVRPHAMPQADIKAASTSQQSISAGVEESPSSTVGGGSQTQSKQGSSHNTNTSSLASSEEGEPIVSISANGTVTVTAAPEVKNDLGSIGEDGKRHGEMGEVPSFAGPIIMAVLGILGFVGVCIYMTYFSSFGKPPPRSGGGKKGSQV
jgi:hypothetical protein